MEKIITVSGAFDKRHPDPKKNFGIHCMQIRFVLKGPKGAAQFLVFTGMNLPHVEDELFKKAHSRGYNPFKPIGVDIGYHAPTPQYEGQTSMKCDVLDGECYYDGTSLGAEEFMSTFLAGGSDAVWEMLQKRYDDQFEVLDGE
jgi:hypothetical protein